VARGYLVAQALNPWYRDDPRPEEVAAQVRAANAFVWGWETTIQFKAAGPPAYGPPLVAAYRDEDSGSTVCIYYTTWGFDMTEERLLIRHFPSTRMDVCRIPTRAGDYVALLQHLKDNCRNPPTRGRRLWRYLRLLFRRS